MTCTTTDTFVVNWGSDLRVPFNWPNGAGGNANLTGYTLSVIDVHPSLVGRVSATITDFPTGAILIALDWADTIERGRIGYFRLRVTSGAGIDATTNALWVDVA